MTRTRTTRLRRPLLTGSTAVAAMAVTAGLVAATAEPAKAATGPKLSLIAATTSLTLTSWKEDPGVYLDLGTYLTAEGRPLELKVTRKSYKDPVTVTQTVYEGGKAKAKTLPKGTVKDFSGLPGFAEITVTDKAGKKVLNRTEDFCPNNASGRVRPDAPATSKYPESCPTNPFTLGSVWGVEQGWAANTYAGSYTEPVALAAGTYTAKVGVAKKYRDLFGIANKPATVKVTVVERSYEDDQGAAGSAASRSATAGEHTGHEAAVPHTTHRTAPGRCPLVENGAAPTAPAVIVAIDGPSGTGKSSTSKAVAAQLGLSYLDTGAQYRAITWWMVTNGIDTDDPHAVAAAAGKPEIVSGTDPAGPTITVDGVDVAGPIRTQEVTSKVSAVSAVPEVRARITELQRTIAAAAPLGIVVEGRDIGTTVLPDADLKIFLTASAEARAARRSGELKGADVHATREALIKRDAADSSRKTSPLAKAGDAVEVDTTALSLPQVIECVVTLVEEKRAGK